MEAIADLLRSFAIDGLALGCAASVYVAAWYWLKAFKAASGPYRLIPLHVAVLALTVVLLSLLVIDGLTQRAGGAITWRLPAAVLAAVLLDAGMLLVLLHLRRLLPKIDQIRETRKQTVKEILDEHEAYD